MAKWDMGDVGNNRIIVDDFLPEEDYKKILEVINDQGFDWHLADKITLEQKDKDIFFYLCHVFYNQTSLHQSKYFELMFPLLKKIDPKALIRVKCNLYLNQGLGVKEHAEHTDYPFKHKGALYSLNTCDGYTKIGEEKIPSVANRIIFFDPSVPHCSTSCSDSKTRMNININYF
tara:strand:+ start:23 stop:544 length:522 start_codon:yes stop_codon:yes gene_type:complete